MCIFTNCGCLPKLLRGPSRQMQPMNMFRASLTIGGERSHHRNVVRVGTTLAQVFEQIDLDGPPYVVIVRDDGAPAGILAVAELLQRIAAADPIEREKWASRPVETILAVALSNLEPAAGPLNGDRLVAQSQVTGTAFHRARDLVAVALDDDVLVSWKFLQPILTRAERDAVTGLVTRSAFLRSFDCELARAVRGGKSLSVILIDIDRFKHVNDHAGHAMGDAVLNMVAAAILTSVRSYDVAARFAGDEFVALCCECGPDQVHIPIHRIQHAVAQLPPAPDAQLQPVTLSIGAAALARVDADVTAEALLEAADACLYEAKRHGRNCAFTADLTAEVPPQRVPRRVPLPVTVAVGRIANPSGFPYAPNRTHRPQ